MMTATYPVNENKGHLGAIPESKNFIKQFNNAGYNTSYVGKWHLGEGDSNPKPFGFSHSYAAGRAGGIGVGAIDSGRITSPGNEAFVFPHSVTVSGGSSSSSYFNNNNNNVDGRRPDKVVCYS